METITINRKDILILENLIEEVKDRLESLELMSNPEVMESLRRSEEQIKKGQLREFDTL